jgi:hypothetical protein
MTNDLLPQMRETRSPVETLHGADTRIGRLTSGHVKTVREVGERWL